MIYRCLAQLTQMLKEIQRLRPRDELPDDHIIRRIFVVQIPFPELKHTPKLAVILVSGQQNN